MATQRRFFTRKMKYERFVSRGAPWTPNTPGSLVSWWDASILGLLNGANVTTFTDRNGGTYNLTTSFSTVPTYITNYQNGLGAVFINSYAGTPTGFDTGGPESGIYPMTIAAVVNTVDLNSERVIVGGANDINIGGLSFGISTSGNLYVNKSFTSIIATSTGTVSTGSAHLVVLVITASTYAFYIDGTVAGSGTHSTALNSPRPFALGEDGTVSYMVGGICEVEIYNSALSGGDLSALHSYIVSKWATP